MFITLRSIASWKYRYLILSFMPSLAWATETTSTEDYYFDNALLRESGLSRDDLERLNQEQFIKPGTYELDVYVNGVFVTRSDILFSATDKGSLPCLNYALLQQIGLKSLPEQGAVECYSAGDMALKNIVLRYDIPQLRIDMTIAQAMLKTTPRGSINPESLDSGESMVLMNYLLNQYHVSSRRGDSNDTNSTFLNLDGGFNVGMWRYRQQSSLNYDTLSGSQWKTNRRYVQRGILPLKSEIMIGEGYTDGRFFSGMGFRGLQMKTDLRMLPESQRGFAPVVRGIARSNAKVSIRQGSSILYETTVVPGPFSIDDLYPTNFSGDLTVVVTEADGSESTFDVPFSALPESIRPGLFNYTATAGRVRDIGGDEPFTELIWQQGVTNTFTANLGNQLADGYQALMFGGVYNSAVGAFGLDTTWSRARMEEARYRTGWMFRLNYSKYFSQTGTSIALAGYRYSTRGFIGLSDALGVRQAEKKGQEWQSSSWQQRSRVEASASQQLGGYGHLTLSASSQDYRDGKGRDTQLQFGWSKTFQNSVSLNLSVARTRNIQPLSNSEINYSNDTWSAHSQTMMSLSLSVPLGQQRYAPILSLSANHTSDSGGGYQTSMSGSYGDKDPLSYSLNASTDDRGSNSQWGGSVHKNTPWGGANVSLSSSSDYWQASGSFQGAVVAHRGGLTFGPWVGDSFALVDAPGASGAKVMGGQGARVDMFGYAITPALTPYKYNTVALDPEGMDARTELQTSAVRVVPSAGAAVRLRFSTLRGQALLITLRLADGGTIPMGTPVFDQYDNNVGMVGQGNQVYLRAESEQGEIKMKWAVGTQAECKASYRFAPTEETILMLSLPCSNN